MFVIFSTFLHPLTLIPSIILDWDQRGRFLLEFGLSFCLLRQLFGSGDVSCSGFETGSAVQKSERC